MCGALWEPRERALGSWRGRCRGLSMVPPARGLERPSRRAGGARGASGAGRPLAPLLFFFLSPPLPASQPRRSGAPPPTWAPPRGHRHTCCCCGRLSCCCCCRRCRSGGRRRAPGTWPVTCSTVPAWVRPPEPPAQMEKLRPGRQSHFCEAPTDASSGPGETSGAGQGMLFAALVAWVQRGRRCSTCHSSDGRS